MKPRHSAAVHEKATLSLVPATRGLDALDRKRAASLADEGGAAAAAVETRAQKDTDGDEDTQGKKAPAALPPVWIFLPALAGALAALLVWRLVRKDP